MVLDLGVFWGGADIDLAVGTLWDVVAAAKSGSGVSRQAEYRGQILRDRPAASLDRPEPAPAVRDLRIPFRRLCSG